MLAMPVERRTWFAIGLRGSDKVSNGAAREAQNDERYKNTADSLVGGVLVGGDFSSSG